MTERIWTRRTSRPMQYFRINMPKLCVDHLHRQRLSLMASKVCLMPGICHNSGLNEVAPPNQSCSGLGTEPGHHGRPAILGWQQPPPALRIPKLSDLPTSVSRCLSFLLRWWGCLGDSHATAQCLNKRVYLIQLSPQGHAKWALVPCDKDNERAEGGGWRGGGSVGRL